MHLVSEINFMTQTTRKSSHRFIILIFSKSLNFASVWFQLTWQNIGGWKSSRTSNIVQLKKVSVLKEIWKSTNIADCFIKEIQNKFKSPYSKKVRICVIIAGRLKHEIIKGSKGSLNWASTRSLPWIHWKCEWVYSTTRLSVELEIPKLETFAHCRVYFKYLFRSVIQQKHSNLNIILKLNLQKKNFFGANISRSKNWKIDQIIGKKERIAIKKRKHICWDNAWAMDDFQVCNRKPQYHQRAYTCSTHTSINCWSWTLRQTDETYFRLNKKMT